METIFTGMALALLIILQWFMIWECIRMKGTVAEHSTDLRTEMGNLGTLLDEALDFLADSVPKQASLLGQIVQDAQTTPDLKEVILSAFLSRINMTGDHASETQPQEREIYEQQPETTEEEITEHTVSSRDGLSG